MGERADHNAGETPKEDRGRKERGVCRKHFRLRCNSRKVSAEPLGSPQSKTAHHRDFPGGLAVKILRFHCKGCGFDPRLGHYDPTRCMAKN